MPELVPGTHVFKPRRRQALANGCKTCHCPCKACSLTPKGPAMPQVTYIEHDGTEHLVDVPLGVSVMRGAVDNNVPGIDADCGGECACATCHVYVDAPWLALIGRPVPGSQEAGMLSFAAVVQDNSRLSCQITMTEILDGLVVRMPEGQH